MLLTRVDQPVNSWLPETLNDRWFPQKCLCLFWCGRVLRHQHFHGNNAQSFCSMTTHFTAEEAKLISLSSVKICILFLLLSRSVKVKEVSSTCCSQYYRELGITLPVIFVQVPQTTNTPLGQKRTPAVSAKLCLTLF